MTKTNPCNLKGFSFLEFSGPQPDLLHQQFHRLGFTKNYLHKTQPITLYQQNNIQFIVNATQNTQAEQHATQHGAGACAMGFEVEDVNKAYAYVLNHGAKAHEEPNDTQHHLPAIQAIGGSVIYFTDRFHQPFATDWQSYNEPSQNAGLNFIDHVTHNVYRGNMDKWADFYQDLFNFEQIRFFDIEGIKTGLISRALASPDGNIKIPLNESKDDVSQIEEFLKDYQGEGIQHIALHTDQIYRTVDQLRTNQVHFLDVPDTYYEAIPERLPWHQESISELHRLKILLDGESTSASGLLLQIFTENTFGPVFFEIIQRKGNQGFGEGNFRALFEAIERDQIKRGTLK
jgi:4-hydroxyphenylpyruvate dioxygenase